MTDNNLKSLKIISFNSRNEWRNWLLKYYAEPEGLWIRFYKKNSGIDSIDHEEALEEAICFGWIDGQLKKYDENSWIQKFTPRRHKSIWSKQNVVRAEKLIKLGKMEPSGLKAINLAKSDGRWNKAYDSSINMKFPEDFLKELSKNKKSLKFFESLDRNNKYSIAWRLQTAIKPETKKKRMAKILEMISKGEKFH
jgi:uncharacterized protein YdeI (YjbR/CyaY-like superfamily)